MTLRLAAALLAAAVLCLPLSLAAQTAELEIWTSGGPLGGNVYAIAVDPAHPATMYTGGHRGVFKSVDGGASWNLAGTGLPPTRVQTVAVDPSNPSNVYAGTLTANGIPSVGVFKSEDAGATWFAADVGLFDPVTAVGPVDIQSLAIDPKNPQVVIAGTFLSEIFRSADGGTTWQASTIGGNSLGLETTAIVFDPSNSSNVYAASSLGFLLSTNNGASWSTAGNAGVRFFGLAVDPTAPKTLYAGDAGGSGIWKSTDGGGHWSTMNVGLPGSSNTRPLVLTLAVDRDNPATVYAGTFGNGLFVSTNGGAAWTASASGLRDTKISSLLALPGAVFAGTFGGGIFRSGDGGGSWTASNGNLLASLVYSVVLDPADPGLIFATTSDGVFRSSDAGLSWRETDSGLPAVTVPSFAIAQGGGERLLAGTLGNGMFASVDRGATWAAVASGLSDSYLSSIAVDPSAPSKVYAGTAHPFTGSNSERIFKSTDGGVTWTQTSLDAGQFTVDFISVDPADGSRLFAGSGGTIGLFQSVDAGVTWSTMATDPLCGGLNALAFDPAGANLYAAGTSGVCRSADQGKTWNLAPTGGLSADSIFVDPASPSTIYAGTDPDLSTGDAGVFISTDGGRTFAALGAGFPSSATGALALDPATGILYAGTFGAGVSRLVPERPREPAVPPTVPRRPPRSLPPRG